MTGYHEEDVQTLPCGCTLNVLEVDTTHRTDGPPFHVKLSEAPPEEPGESDEDHEDTPTDEPTDPEE